MYLDEKLINKECIIKENDIIDFHINGDKQIDFNSSGNYFFEIFVHKMQNKLPKISFEQVESNEIRIVDLDEPCLIGCLKTPQSVPHKSNMIFDTSTHDLCECWAYIFFKDDLNQVKIFCCFFLRFSLMHI